MLFRSKGSQVYIEGKLTTRKWTDQAGVEKYTTEIHVNVGGTMQMLGGKQDSSSKPAQNRAPQQSGQQAPQRNDEPPMDFDSDIPF